MMPAIKRFISVKRFYSLITILCTGLLISGFVYIKNWYSNPDFGKSFGAKAEKAASRLTGKQELFALCAPVCGVSSRFMQSLVFPEVMRYNTIKDGIETESLRTLYVQFGKEYANFSVGLFQMKPSFAEAVEEKAKLLLPDSIYKELQLEYVVTGAEEIRSERVTRLQDDDFQLVYLTAFICICNKTCAYKNFSSETEKLQWYATIYNAGFNRTDDFLSAKINESNFYLQQGMPGKKFRYAAIATWFYAKKPNNQ